jgi:serine/threonine protein kinase
VATADGSGGSGGSGEREDGGGERAGDIPRVVDRFVVEQELGAGGMGRVYLARDPDLDRKVAIKLLRDEPSLDVEKAHARMAREARAMARLRHPNVVTSWWCTRSASTRAAYSS